MTGNILRRLFCAVLCIGLLCGCTAATESTEPPPEPAKTKAAAKREQVSVEVQRIETVAEVPPGDPELNGRLWEGPIPEDFDFRNRLFIDGADTCYLIEMDGKMVRWGRNPENIDAGWDGNDGIQPFSKRNVLVEDARKITIGYLTTLAIDCHENLWGWGYIDKLLLREGNSREPVKVLSGVKDMALGDFYAAAVRTDGRLQVWGRQEGWEEPVTIRTGVEKVYIAREVLLFLDAEHNLSYFQSGWSNKMEGFLDEPVLLDTEVEDLQFLNFTHFLKLKTDGTVELPDYRQSPQGTSRVLAKDGILINNSGYLTADGTFRRVEIKDDVIQVTTLASAYSVYNVNGDSIHLMKDGEIRVCLSE